MTAANLYRDIAARTGGDIYIGVVGPVRSGKSTFIKRFMETVVIPNIEGEHDRTRARDELPQSAGGRTVMTTEPKFIPDEAVRIRVGDCGQMNVRMVDCVGYLVPDVLGDTENGTTRMVQTPWSEAPLPFAQAAEIGTRRVITEHSTIGMLVTTDGTIGDIPRENYREAEERVARELREIGKPFAVILNSAHPESPEAEAEALALEKKYGAPVALVSCLELNADDIAGILEMVLMEFPLRDLHVTLPEWCDALEEEHWLRASLAESALQCAQSCRKIGEAAAHYAVTLAQTLTDTLQPLVGETVTVGVEGASMDLGCGKAMYALTLPGTLYYRILSELSGVSIGGERELISQLRSLASAHREYERYAEAIAQLEEHGYGIVMPDVDSLTLEEPEIVRQAGSYGVRLRASAPSVHMIRATIETEISPIVGTEQQSEELVQNLLRDFEADPKQLWESNLFGRSLYDLVNDGLHAKLAHMPQDARLKLGETLSRVINEGSGGLICIIL